MFSLPNKDKENQSPNNNGVIVGTNKDGLSWASTKKQGQWPLLQGVSNRAEMNDEALLVRSRSIFSSLPAQNNYVLQQSTTCGGSPRSKSLITTPVKNNREKPKHDKQRQQDSISDLPTAREKIPSCDNDPINQTENMRDSKQIVTEISKTINLMEQQFASLLLAKSEDKKMAIMLDAFQSITSMEEQLETTLSLSRSEGIEQDLLDDVLDKLKSSMAQQVQKFYDFISLEISS